MGFIYATEERWDSITAALLRSADRGDPAGLDTEFYGFRGGQEPAGVESFDVRKASCAGGRTRVHVWSVAIKRWPHTLHPRGYYLSDAAVLPAAALEHPGLRGWLESPAQKVVHNLSVDDHSLFNHGIQLNGAINTLSLARWVWPHRARGAGYALDTLGVDLLGAGKTEDYSQLFSEEVEETVRVKETRTKHCSCGVEKCRKRKPEEFTEPDGEFWVRQHRKEEVVTQEPVLRMVKRDIPLESVIPGHPRWERAVAYAAKDAVLALGVFDRAQREMQQEVPWPW